MQIRDAIVIALTVLIYAMLRRLYFRICQLPARAYHKPSIIIEGCRRPAFVLLAAGTILPVFLLGPGLAWSRFDDGSLLRIVIGAAAIMLAWINCSYEVNAYFGREHLLDRALVLVLGILVIVHPAFVLAFLLVMVTVWRQVAHPRAIPDAVSDKLLPVDLLIAFAAFLLVGAFVSLSSAAGPVGGKTWHFMTVAFGLVGMHYVHAGWAKVRLRPRPWTWILGNRLSDLTMNSWMHGYARFLPQSRVVRIVRRLRPLNVPLQAVTIAIELGAILLLADRALAIVLLSSLVAMHGAILLASGITFWKWAIVDAALIVFAASASPGVQGALFSPGALACAVVIVLLGRWHSSPAPLGWFDSPLVEVFRYEVVGRDGKTYALPNAFFAPYDLAFCQGRFGYLCDEPPAPHFRSLVATHGTIRDRTGLAGGAWKLRRLIDRSKGSPRRIAQLRRRYGMPCTDRGGADQAIHFDSFIRRSFAHLEQTGRKATVFGCIPHPKHFRHWPVRDAGHHGIYRMQAPVVRFRVRFIEAFTDPDHFTILTDRIVREVDIPAPGIAGQIAPTTPGPLAAGHLAAARRMAEARAG